MTGNPDPAMQEQRFLWLYALAWAGGCIAYTPFLTVLLPVRVSLAAETGAGPAAVDWLAYLTFTGAICASAGNILFGWLSDITGNRRGWIAAGLILSSAALVSMPLAQTLPAQIGLIAVWQLMLNMMLGPLAAWAGDCVPDRQKGRLGGFLSVAPAMGGAAGMLVTIPGLAGPDARLWIVAALVACAILPVLIFGRPRAFPELTRRSDEPGHATVDRQPHGPMVRMWLARCLIQVSEAALFAFMFLWFRTLQSDFSDASTSRVFGLVLVASIPVAMLAGRWADRIGRPVLPLVLATGSVAFGLIGMSFAPTIGFAIAGYAIFCLSAAVFLALHSAQTLRYLPRPERRGRDIGIFNLTNTFPALLAPWLTLAMVPVVGFEGLFLLLAGLALLAGLLLVPLMRAR